MALNAAPLILRYMLALIFRSIKKSDA